MYDTTQDEPTPRTSWNPEVTVDEKGLVHITYAGLEMVLEPHRVPDLISKLDATVQD